MEDKIKEAERLFAEQKALKFRKDYKEEINKYDENESDKDNGPSFSLGSIIAVIVFMGFMIVMGGYIIGEVNEAYAPNALNNTSILNEMTAYLNGAFPSAIAIVIGLVVLDFFIVPLTRNYI